MQCMYLFAVYYFPLHKPKIDSIQETDLIVGDYFSKEISIAGMYFLHIMPIYTTST